MFSQREFGLWFKLHFGNLANEEKLNKKGNVAGVLFTARRRRRNFFGGLSLAAGILRNFSANPSTTWDHPPPEMINN